MDISKNRGGRSPKMDGENNGSENPMNKWMISHYFWKHPYVKVKGETTCLFNVETSPSPTQDLFRKLGEKTKGYERCGVFVQPSHCTTNCRVLKGGCSRGGGVPGEP